MNFNKFKIGLKPPHSGRTRYVSSQEEYDEVLRETARKQDLNLEGFSRLSDEQKLHITETEKKVCRK